MIPDYPKFRFTLKEECQYHQGKGKHRASSPGGLLEAVKFCGGPPSMIISTGHFPRTSASPSPNEARLAAGSSGRETRRNNFLFGAKFLIKQGNTWDFNPFYCCNNKLQLGLHRNYRELKAMHTFLSLNTELGISSECTK